MRFCSLPTVLLSLFWALAPAQAQDSGKTILVFDASGSMWGQIDGKTKIEIAQSVVGNLLDDLPGDQILGLTAYGHNRKGDCSDIETLVEPAANTRDAIRAAVNGIKPKGKTPLSEAVIRAAEALKYTEDKATVILISDGRETCDFDPCEVGRRLEESGVDFTAHVVGFDVANPADRAQLQCLAENTGGQFITASNASELTTALQKVSAPVAPTPQSVTFAAVLQGTTTRITENLIWSLTNTDDGTELVDFEATDAMHETLLPGNYLASVLRTTDEAGAELTLRVSKNTATTVFLELPEYSPKATLDATTTAAAGSTLDVTWSGPNAEGDFISAAEIGSRPGAYITYAYPKDGNPLTLRMPAQPGDYELRYMWDDKPIAKRTISVTPVTATLAAVETAVAGSKIVVNWTGPDYKHDYIAVAEIGARPGKYLKYTYTRDGAPLQLQMPVDPGKYELRYVMKQDTTVIASKPITITDVSATLDAPDTASAGDTVVVSWTGPDYKGDFVSVAKTDARDGKYITYTYTRHGSPMQLKMPPEPGDYEIRYVVNQGDKVISRRPITVGAVTANLKGPETASAGATVLVEWQGPDYKSDFISVAKVDSPDNKYLTYTYTRHGSPMQLKMPADPGDYVIRYVQNQGNKILASQPVTVTAVGATLTVPPTATAGDSILLEWTGPDYQGDFISVAEIGMPDGKYHGYTYTRHGSPTSLKLPLLAGDYEIRYIQNQGRTVLARQIISVTATTASLSAPETALSGEPLLMQWTGPDYQGDYVAVSEIGMRDSKYINYTYTRQGSPTRLIMPAKPGNYELRYVAKGSPVAILARRPITVTMAEASVQLSGEATGGEPAIITWTGPDFAGDYISVAKVGERGYETYEPTRNGNPLRITMPERAGQYELRYVLKEGDTILTKQVIEVK